MSQSFISKQILIDADLMYAQLVEIGIFGPKAVLNTSPLSSGRMRRTRCQISAGADAPVAPVLTRPLFWILKVALTSKENPQFHAKSSAAHPSWEDPNEVPAFGVH